jgi:acetyl esterase/lipase
LRVIEPSGPIRGVYLHFHGGGWVLGRPHHVDYLNERMADATGLVVVSPYYRLAPEDPFPAGPDDAEASAWWVAEQAAAQWGTSVLCIGGESAGSHLAATTLVRLRDRHSAVPFRAANLLYGVFDLSLSPSARSFGDPPVTFGQTTLSWMIGHFIGDRDPADPSISPLYADLVGLCPALFTVGTRDPLLDDTLFMAARWSAAGNPAVLAVQPGGHHAFDYYDDPPGLAARERMYSFLASFLD